MEWISSLGGPLILAPRWSMDFWSGSYGPSGEDDIDEEETAYWQISEDVADYAGVVKVGNVDALVLANGSSPTTYVPEHGLFVQILAETAVVDVIDGALRLLPSVAWQHQFEWLSAGPSLLFDSARYGPGVGPTDAVEVDVAEGRHLVRCAYQEPEAGGAGIWVALTQVVVAA